MPTNEFQTEVEFELPRGYNAEDGVLHRKGKMRLATALDEISAQEDPRVLRNEHYLVAILLARVVTELGSLEVINTHVIEHLYAMDFAYLEDLYARLNREGSNAVNAVCPKCHEEFAVEIMPGED